MLVPTTRPRPARACASERPFCPPPRPPLPQRGLHEPAAPARRGRRCRGAPRDAGPDPDRGRRLFRRRRPRPRAVRGARGGARGGGAGGADPGRLVRDRDGRAERGARAGPVGRGPGRPVPEPRLPVAPARGRDRRHGPHGRGARPARGRGPRGGVERAAPGGHRRDDGGRRRPPRPLGGRDGLRPGGRRGAGARRRGRPRRRRDAVGRGAPVQSRRRPPGRPRVRRLQVAPGADGDRRPRSRRALRGRAAARGDVARAGGERGLRRAHRLLRRVRGRRRPL